MALVTYPGAGCIVEYLEANALHIALVLEEQGGKLRLLLPNRRETKLGSNRLLPWSGPVIADISSRDLCVNALMEHREKRNTLAENIDPLELWELAQGEMDKATAQWFAELFGENLSVDTIAAYGHALLECKSHFKFNPPHFEIFTQETVQKRLQEQEAVRQREAIISGGAAFFRMLLEVHNKKRNLPPADSSEWPDAQVLELLEKMLRQRIADPECTEDEALWRMLSKGLPTLPHVPLILAMAWGIVPPHHNFWFDRADYTPGDAWSDAYTETILDIVAKVDAGNTSTSMPFVSIDSSSTRDIDDAFYMEENADGTLRLHLALACPALLWPFAFADASSLDKAVLRRATSVYLPEGTHHMLPEILGTDKLSLLAQHVRPALCVTCDVNLEGRVTSCTPHIEWVQLAANLCYEDCEAVLENSAENAATPYTEQLQLGEKLAVLRQNVRVSDGAVILERPDTKVLLEGEGADIKVSIEESSHTPKAQLLVSEMMILASAAMGSWAKEQNIPLWYRTQDVAVPREYAGVWKEPHHMARIIKTLVPSVLEMQPRNHVGLGLSAYAPITSPLRRYTDLINEAQVVHYLLMGTPRFTQENLEHMLLSVQMRLDAAGQIQRFRPRYWRLVYLRQRGDKIWYDAVVTEENDTFATVNLPLEQIFLRGKRHFFGERACPGQQVQVRIGKVNPLLNEMSLLEVIEM